MAITRPTKLVISTRGLTLEPNITSREALQIFFYWSSNPHTTWNSNFPKATFGAIKVSLDDWDQVYRTQRENSARLDLSQSSFGSERPALVVLVIIAQNFSFEAKHQISSYKPRENGLESIKGYKTKHFVHSCHFRTFITPNPKLAEVVKLYRNRRIGLKRFNFRYWMDSRPFLPGL